MLRPPGMFSEPGRLSLICGRAVFTQKRRAQRGWARALGLSPQPQRFCVEPSSGDSGLFHFPLFEAVGLSVGDDVHPVQQLPQFRIHLPVQGVTELQQHNGCGRVRKLELGRATAAALCLISLAYGRIPIGWP